MKNLKKEKVAEIIKCEVAIKNGFSAYAIILMEHGAIPRGISDNARSAWEKTGEINQRRLRNL